MNNIVVLKGCKEVSGDIYAYFTCDAGKALKALEYHVLELMMKELTTFILMMMKKLFVSI